MPTAFSIAPGMVDLSTFDYGRGLVEIAHVLRGEENFVLQTAVEVVYESAFLTPVQVL